MDAVTRCRTCGVRDDVLTDDGRCITCWSKAMDAAEGVTYRYFVTERSADEREVTKEEWVSAERQAGFYNTMGHPEEPGTGGFSTTQHGGLKGRIERVVPDAS